MTTLTLNIRDLLRSNLGDAITAVPSSIDLEEVLDLNDLTECAFDLSHHLEDQRQIAILWSVEDVKDRRPDLSESQAWDVLKRCEHEHDANHGITWDTIEQTAYDMFGSGNSQRVTRCEQALSNYTDDTDSDANLVDFLTDAMHWCEEHDREFDNMLRIAKEHFTVEAAE